VGLPAAQAMQEATSLEDVAGAHARFMSAALRQCLCARDRTWQLIADAVRRILDLGLQFADLAPSLFNPVRSFPPCPLFHAESVSFKVSWASFKALWLCKALNAVYNRPCRALWMCKALDFVM
jgi:hypothetical protein